MENTQLKIGWWSVVMTVGLILIFFNLFGSSLLFFLFKALGKQLFSIFSYEYDIRPLIFGFTMGVITFIFGILIGTQKNINKITTSFIAGFTCSVLYILTLVPMRIINIGTGLLVFGTIIIPMVLGTWLMSIFKSNPVV